MARLRAASINIPLRVCKLTAGRQERTACNSSDHGRWLNAGIAALMLRISAEEPSPLGVHGLVPRVEPRLIPSALHVRMVALRSKEVSRRFLVALVPIQTRFRLPAPRVEWKSKIPSSLWEA